MTTERTGAAPEGYTSVAPWVVTEDGSIGHGEVRVGDTVVLAFDRRTDRPVVPSLPRPT